MKHFTCSIFVMMAFSTSTLAWEAKIDGPDVFGKIKAITMEVNGRDSLIVQCDSSGEVFLAYIEKKKEFEEVQQIAAKLYVKTTSEAPVILDAELRSWNDDYSGVVVSSTEQKLTETIYALGAAKGKIEIGVEIVGQQYSASFSSRGSKKAIDSTVVACNLSRPAVK